MCSLPFPLFSNLHAQVQNGKKRREEGDNEKEKTDLNFGGLPLFHKGLTEKPLLKLADPLSLNNIAEVGRSDEEKGG